MTVREVRREDLPQVAELWLKAFRGQRRRAPQALRDYFQLIFFGAPWRDPELPSLVYEEDGRIAGFLGVMPRILSFGGQPARAAVLTQIIADKDARSRDIALSLARRCVAGPQDLTYCDGANEAAERLLRAADLEVARLYNLTWLRLLRPAQYFAALVQRRMNVVAFGAALGIACRAADALLAFGPGSLRLPARADGLLAREAGADALAPAIREMAAGRALVPVDDAAAFGWLLDRAAEKRRHGTLVRRLLLEQDGAVAGWYLFYARPGGVAQVLQYAARAGRIGDVLHRLFREARERGAVAVAGQLDPPRMTDLASAACTFAWPGYTVLAHSRRPELMAAIHRGDAWLTRLDGEWWPRFSDPSWSEPERAPIEKEIPACAAPQA